MEQEAKTYVPIGRSLGGIVGGTAALLLIGGRLRGLAGREALDDGRGLSHSTR